MPVKQVEVVERSDASPFCYSAMNSESSWKKSQKKKKKETTLCWQPKVKKKFFWHTLCIHSFSHTLVCFYEKINVLSNKAIVKVQQTSFFWVSSASRVYFWTCSSKTWFSNVLLKLVRENYILLTSLCSLVTSSILIFCLINFVEIMVSTHKTKYVCCQFIYILSSLPVKLSCSK